MTTTQARRPQLLEAPQAKQIKNLKKSTLVKNLLKSKQQYKLKKLFSNYMVDKGKARPLYYNVLIVFKNFTTYFISHSAKKCY